MELLSTNDLNHIIKAVDDDTSVFKRCALFDQGIHESHLLLGKDTEYMIRESASLTELVKTKIQITDTRQTPNVFLKIWFGWNALSISEKTSKIDTYYKKHASDALRIFGDQERFLDDIIDDSSSTSLDHEANIYDYITDFIITPNLSPNFIPLLTKFECRIKAITQSLNKTADFIRKDTLLEKLVVLHKLFPTLSLKFIMTGSAPSVQSAGDFFRSLPPRGIVVIDDSEYASIIFQFFHAHYIMSIFGIVHNDNHMGNVLIQTLATPVTLDIRIGDFHTRFTTRYIVKFFDWDRAYYTMGSRNPLASMYLNIRNVDKFTPGRDFSAFVCFLYTIGVTKVNQIIDRLIMGPKPTKDSNIDRKKKGPLVIRGAETPMLRSWMVSNPENVIVDPSDIKTSYITISKRDFERIIPKAIGALRDKLGPDIYDSAGVTNVYLSVKGKNVFIHDGFLCHPMYDSKNLQVEQYFIDDLKFKNLCFGLVTNPFILPKQQYKYILLYPAWHALHVDNLIYTKHLKTFVKV